MTVAAVHGYSYIPEPPAATRSLETLASLAAPAENAECPYVFPREAAAANHTCMWKKITLFLLFSCAMKGGMVLAESFESLDAIINVDKQVRGYKQDKKMQKKAEKRREREKERRHHQRDNRGKHRGDDHDYHGRHR